MQRFHRAFVIGTNVPAADALLYEKSWDSSVVSNKDLLLYGIQYSVRVLQSGIPDVTPLLGVAFSVNKLEAALWNASDDRDHYGMIHFDAYDQLPCKDLIEIPGGPADIKHNETIHLGLFVDNRDQLAAFNKTLRVHATFYYETKDEHDRRELEKWRRILTSL